MEDLIAQYEGYLAQVRMLSRDVMRRYVSVLETFRAFLQDEVDGGIVSLEAVPKRQLEAFLRAHTGGTGTPSRSGWNNRLAALRSFYGFLFRSELVGVNPALRVDRLRVNGRERQPLSFEEVFALVDALEHHSGERYRLRNVAIVQVFFHCALRVAEVVSLNVEQIDFDHYVLRDVRRKGDKYLGAVFNDVVADALQRYLGIRETLVGDGGQERALFVSDRGTRLSKRTIQGMLARYGAIANIGSTVTPHRLRHSNVTELVVDMGTPLPVVQEICGHASAATTERYVHVNGSQRRRAVNELGERWQRHGRAREPQTVGQSSASTTGQIRRDI